MAPGQGVVPVVLCIDVEPASRWPESRSDARWEGLDLVHAWVERLRPIVEDVTGHPLVVTWFLRFDDQIAATYGSATYVHDRHGDLLDAARSAGDGFGVHVHAWTHRGERGWIDDQGDGERLQRCIDDAVTNSRQTIAMLFGLIDPSPRRS